MDGHRQSRATSEGPNGNPAEHDHGDLLSELADHDLAFPTDPEDRVADDTLVADDERPPEAVFPHSVASGGPTPEGVILWTRIDPAAFTEGLDLGVEVAADPAFDDVAYAGTVTDEAAITAHDYTVKVDLDGQLDPDTRYHYRFVYDGVASQVGRCRTLPAADARVEELSLAVLTCQNYANGYYGALHHVAQEDVDFVVHVGDFIYESDDGHFKGVGSHDFRGRDKELPSGHDRVHTLADYRYLYRLYKSDRFLQELLESHTLIPAWDDHEIANDIYWDYEVDAPRADHPKGDDPEFMTELTADAIHAWWEYMPARIQYDPTADSLQDRFQLWRSIDVGDLVDLVMTDERLFRNAPLDVGLPTRNRTAPENEPPGRSMLGDDQKEWLLEETQHSEAVWTVWTDEVLTMPFRLGAGPASLFPVQGGWDGYQRERAEIYDALADVEVTNFVTLTGDMHCYVAGYQQTEYREPYAEPVPEEKRIGVEFMTPAVTSLNVAEGLGVNRWPIEGASRELINGFVRRCNPHLEYFDSHHNGYSVVEFTREHCTYVAYAVDKTVDSPEAEKELMTALRCPEGEVRLEDVADEYEEASGTDR